MDKETPSHTLTFRFPTEKDANGFFKKSVSLQGRTVAQNSVAVLIAQDSPFMHEDVRFWVGMAAQHGGTYHE